MLQNSRVVGVCHSSSCPVHQCLLSKFCKLQFLCSTEAAATAHNEEEKSEPVNEKMAVGKKKKKKKEGKMVATRATSSLSLSTTSSVEALPPRMYSPAFCTSKAVALAVELSVMYVSVSGPVPTQQALSIISLQVACHGQQKGGQRTTGIPKQQQLWY